MVDINVNKNQGLISAIKTKLNAEQIDTSKCDASIWSQVLEQVTIENEQNKKELITADKTSGRHNGADPLLIDMVFGKDIPDPLGKQADSFAGMTSALIGISANDSISSGKIINLTKRLNKLR